MSQLTLNLVEGSISFSFSPQGARELKTEIDALMERLKTIVAKGSGGKPNPQKSLEYRYTGEVFLEIFCNPNIFANPFVAKVWITLRDNRIKISTQAELTRLIEDINHYLEIE